MHYSVYIVVLGLKDHNIHGWKMISAKYDVEYNLEEEKEKLDDVVPDVIPEEKKPLEPTPEMEDEDYEENNDSGRVS